MTSNRFPIRPGGSVLRGLMRLIGVRPGARHVDLEEDRLLVRFGYARAEIGFDEIAAVEVRPWPALRGFGLRFGPERSLGYVAAPGDVVWVRLRSPKPLQIGPAGLTRQREAVALGVDDPTSLAEAIRQRL